MTGIGDPPGFPQVRAHPHQVTIYAAGSLTNIALAIALDPGFAARNRGIVFMGGSLNPETTDPEFATDPRHEFNLWIEPSIITKEQTLYMDVDLSHSPSYGDTLTWLENLKPQTGVRRVRVQLGLDLPRFPKLFVKLMTRKS